jgi:hypothetical protein
MRLGLFNSTAGPQDDRLMGVNDSNPEFRPGAQRLFNQRAQVMQVDDDLAEPMPLQQQQAPDDEWRSADRQQWLGNGIRQRSQACTEAGCKNHGLHTISAED